MIHQGVRLVMLLCLLVCALLLSVGNTAQATRQVTVQAPLTSVALTANLASPQVVNTPITLIATPTDGGTVEYKFRAGYTDAAGWHWSDLTGYTTTRRPPKRAPTRWSCGRGSRAARRAMRSTAR